MFQLFKSLRVAYIVLYFSSFLLGLFLIVFLSGEWIRTPTSLDWNPTQNTLIVAIIALVLWLTFVMVMMRKLTQIANKKIRVLQVNTLEACKIQEFIDANYKFLILTEKKAKTARMFVLLELANGYLTIGDYSSAKNILCQFPSPKRSAQYATYVVQYTYLMFRYYLQTCHTEKAAINLEKMNEALENEKVYSHWRPNLIKQFEMGEVLLRMNRSEFDGVKYFFETRIEDASSKIEKVTLKFYLGQAYINDEQFPEAKAEFEYVVKQGGDTRFVSLAKEYLEQIRSRGETV